MKRVSAVLAALLLLVSAGASGAKNIKSTTVTISLGSDLETMDPHTNTSALTTTLHRYLFDTLMHRPNGTDLQPWAAKSFKQIDAKTLEFHMREGVTFSNGEEVDAQAVRYSLMRPLQPGFKTVLMPLFRVIDRIDVVSKWVVRIHMKTSDPGLLRRLADYGHLVPPRYYSRLSPEEASQKPVGSGPYRLARWEKGVEIIFEANPNYWKPDAPQLKTVRVVPIKEDGTKVAALLKGEIDLVNQVPAQYIEKLKSAPDTRVELVRGTRVFHIGFTHGVESPLKDVRVRKAVAHAIDRNVLVKNVVEGYGVVANQPLHQWTEGYDAKRVWPYEFNPQKSRQLLAEAGFANGIDIDFISPEGRYTKDKEVAQALAGMLQGAGFRVKHQSMVWNRFVEAFNARNNPGAKPFIYYIGYGNGTGDSDASISAVAACKGAWSAYCSNDVDKALDEAAATMDRKKRDGIFRGITSLMASEVSHVMLWQEDSVYGMRKNIVWAIRNDDRVYGWELDKK